MKLWSVLLLLLSFTLEMGVLADPDPGDPLPQAPTVVDTNSPATDPSVNAVVLTNALTGGLPEKGLNHKHVRWIQHVTNDLGVALDVTNVYVHMQPGLHYIDTNGQYVESNPGFSIRGRYAVADRLQFKVRIGGNANSSGYMQVTLPSGQVLRSHVGGLRYYDPISDQAVLIATVKNSQAYVVGDNQVVFQDAFTNVTADIRYTVTKAGVEQDILIHPDAPLPAPEDFGLPSETTRLEVLTEFVNPPAHNRLAVTNSPSIWRGINAPTDTGLIAQDVNIDFGSMQIGPGKAFQVGSTTNGAPIPVGKRWLRINSAGDLAADTEVAARQFLVEAVDLTAADPLAAPQPSGPGGGFMRRGASGKKILAQARTRAIPPQPEASDETAAVRRDPPKSLLAALAGPLFILDYDQSLNGVSFTNFVFHSDYTYFVTGNNQLYGTTVLEGGAVIKMDYWPQGSTPQHNLNIHGPVVCKTTQYLPAVFTARDDDTVGARLTNSTGSVLSNTQYGTQVFLLSWDAPAVDLQYLHFAYFNMGVCCYNGKANRLRHSQFYYGAHGIMAGSSSSIYVGNVLMRSCNDLCGIGSGGTGIFEHVTSDRCYKIHPYYFPGGTFTLRNCLVITNSYSSYSDDLLDWQDGGGNQWAVGSTNGMFVEAVGGNYYLPANSPARGAGVTGIDPVLATDLKGLTVDAPHSISSSITSTLILSPVVNRDTSTYPAVGYHYPVVDYACLNSSITGAKVILTNGVSCIYAMGGAFSMYEGSSFYSTGSPTNLNTIVHYRLVQEAPVANDSSWGQLVVRATTTLHPVISLRYTVANMFGGSQWGALVNQASVNGQYVPVSSFTARDCQFANMWIYGVDSSTSTVTYNLFNNLLSGCVLQMFRQPGNYNQDTPMSITFQNNTFYRTKVNLSYWMSSVSAANLQWFITDNVFDQNSPNLYLTGSGSGAMVTAQYNGFASTNSSTATIGTSPTILNLSNPGYATGPMGRWYPATTAWVDKGSRTAAAAGLYHYTTLTSQVQDGTTTVDLGFHYLATKSSTDASPADTDGDGIPDYVEDPDGTGWVPPIAGGGSGGGSGGGGTGTGAGGSGTAFNNPDSDFDGVSDANEIAAGTNPLDPNSFTHTQLALWTFDPTTAPGTSALTISSQALKANNGQSPLVSTGVFNATSWDYSYVLMNGATPPVPQKYYGAIEIGSSGNDTATRQLQYNMHETGQSAYRLNLGLVNGTIRFWFRPNWTSLKIGKYGNSQLIGESRLLTVGTILSQPAFTGGWTLGIVPNADLNNTSAPDVLKFYGQYPEDNSTQSLSANIIAWQWNDWHQVAITYGSDRGVDKAVTLYVDGERVAALQQKSLPSPTALFNQAFSLGSDQAGLLPARGRFDRLETFNYPLPPSQIRNDYQAMVKRDTDSDGLTDIREDSYGTKLGVADTDSDGLPDGFEAGYTVWLPDGTTVTQIDCSLIPIMNGVVPQTQAHAVSYNAAHPTDPLAGILPSGDGNLPYELVASGEDIINVDFTSDASKVRLGPGAAGTPPPAGSTTQSADLWNRFLGVPRPDPTTTTATAVPDSLTALIHGIPLKHAAPAIVDPSLARPPSKVKMYVGYGPNTFAFFRPTEEICTSAGSLINVDDLCTSCWQTRNPYFCFYNNLFQRLFNGIKYEYSTTDEPCDLRKNHQFISDWESQGFNYYTLMGDYTALTAPYDLLDDWRYSSWVYELSGAFLLYGLDQSARLPNGQYADALYSSAPADHILNDMFSCDQLFDWVSTGDYTVIALDGLDPAPYKIYVSLSYPSGIGNPATSQVPSPLAVTGNPASWIYDAQYSSGSWIFGADTEGNDKHAFAPVDQNWSQCSITPQNGRVRILLPVGTAISGMQIVKQRPPAAPNLTVTGSIGSLRLSWNAVPNATYYNLFRSDTATGAFTQIAHIDRTGTCHWDDGRFKDGVAKYYYAIAGNDYFQSPASAIQSGTTVVCHLVTDNYVVSFDKINHAPIFGVSRPIDKASPSQPYFDISWPMLVAATGARDWDGDVIQFAVGSTIRSGTVQLLKGANLAAAAPTDLFVPGDTLRWTPPAGVSGASLRAFDVTAFDGLVYSDQTVTVAVNIGIPTKLVAWGYSADAALGDGSSVFSFNRGGEFDSAPKFSDWASSDPKYMVRRSGSGVVTLDDPTVIYGDGVWHEVATESGLLYGWGHFANKSIVGLNNPPTAYKYNFGFQVGDTSQSVDQLVWLPDVTYSAPATVGGTPTVPFTDVRKIIPSIQNGTPASPKLVLRTDGTVWEMGADKPGFPTQLPDLNNVIDIAGDGESVILLKSDGSLWWWGSVSTAGPCSDFVTDTGEDIESCSDQTHFLPSDSFFQTDSTHNAGELINVPVPADPLQTQIHFRQVACAGGYYLALADDGTVWEMGIKYRNGIAIDPSNHRPVANMFPTTPLWDATPTKIDGLQNVKAIDTVGNYSLALMQDGTVRAWGCIFGMGMGSNVPKALLWGSKNPVTLPGLSKIKQVSIGYTRGMGPDNVSEFAIAVGEDGRLWGWGANVSLQLMTDDWWYFADQPVLLPGVENVDFAYVGAGTCYAAASIPENRPTHLTALGVNNGVQLTWKQFPGAVLYHVKRTGSMQSSFVEVGTTTSTHYTDLPLVNGQNYIYVVSADYSTGAGVVVSDDSLTANAAPIAPPSITPQNVTLTRSCRNVVISWDDDGSSTSYRVYRAAAVTQGTATTLGPRLQVGNSPSPIKRPGAAAPPVPTRVEFVDSGIADGTYTYYVIGSNGGGDGPVTDPVGPMTINADTTSCLPAPTGLMANPIATTVNGDGASYTVSFSWSALDNPPDDSSGLIPISMYVVGYRLKRFDPNITKTYVGWSSTEIVWDGTTVSVPTTTKDLDVGDGEMDNVVVSAIINCYYARPDFDPNYGLAKPDFTIETANSTPFTFIALTGSKPPQVKGLNARGANNSVMLTWDAQENAATYQVQYRLAATQTSSASEWSTIQFDPIVIVDSNFGDQVYFWHLPPSSVADPINGIKYEYQVRALPSGVVDDTTAGTWSSIVQATPQVPAMDATPLVLNAKANNATVYLWWPAPAGMYYHADWQFFVERRIPVTGSTPPNPWEIITQIGTGLSYLDADVANGVSYDYQLVAFDNFGNRVSSRVNGVIPSAGAGFVSLPVAGNGFVTLKWPLNGAAVGDPVRFDVMRSTSPSGPFASVQVFDLTSPNIGDSLTADVPPQLTYTDLGVNNGTTYYYYIAAEAGGSVFFRSPVASVRPSTAGNPRPPTFSAEFESSSQANKVLIALSWQRTAGATAVQVNYAWSSSSDAPPSQSDSNWVVPDPVGLASGIYTTPHLGWNLPNPNPNGPQFLWIRIRALNGGTTAATTSSPSSDWVMQDAALDYASWKLNNKVSVDSTKVWFVDAPLDPTTGAPLRWQVTIPTNLVLRIGTSLAAVDRVEVFDNDQLIGVSSDYPFQVTWNGVPLPDSSGHSLRAIAYAGTTYETSASVPLDVNWSPQLADYSTSATDLQIPAPGIPIVLSRSYSSASGSDSSLGLGWAASWLSPRVVVDGDLSTDWKISAIDGGRNFTIHDSTTSHHSVHLFLPNGQQLNFRAVPTGMSDIDSASEGKGSVSFAADDPENGMLEWDSQVGLSAALTAVDPFEFGNVVGGEDLTLVAGDSTDDNPPIFGIGQQQAANFIYTSPDGLRWTFSYCSSPSFGNGACWKLVRITDRAGDYQLYKYPSAASGLLSSIEAHTADPISTDPNTHQTSPALRTVSFAWTVGASETDIIVYDPIENATQAAGNTQMPAIRYRLTPSGTPAKWMLNTVERLVNRLSTTPAQYTVTQYNYGNDDGLTSGHNNLNRLVNAKLVPQLISSSLPGDFGSTSSAIGVAESSTTGLVLLSNVYDSNGKLSAQSDARGRTTTLGISQTGNSQNGNQPQIVASQTISGVTVSSTVNYGTDGRAANTLDANGKQSFVQSDAKGRPVTLTAPDKSTKTILYDDLGRPTGEIDAAGYQSYTSLDVFGSPTQVQDKNGNVSNATYDPQNGNPLTETDAADKKTVYSYENATFPNLVTKVEVSGPGIIGKLTTQSIYNSLGELQSSKVWLDQTGQKVAQTDYEYDANGNLNKTTAWRTLQGGTIPDGTRSSKSVSDALGRTVSSEDALSTSLVPRKSTTVYDVFGRAVSTTDIYHRVTQMTYDAVGNLVQTLYPDNTVTRTVYDEANRPIFSLDRVSLGNSSPTVASLTGAGSLTTYDAAGRAIATARYPSATVTLQSDSVASAQVATTVSYSGSAGSRTRTVYDDNGRVWFRIDPVGSVTGYTYDLVGRVAVESHYTVLQPQFLDLATTVSMANQASTQTTYGYDANGNRIWMVDANNQSAAGTDPASRVHQNHRTDYVYDAANRLRSTASPLVSTDGQAQAAFTPQRKTRSTQYDAAGRKLFDTDENGVITDFNYDPAGNLTSVIQDYRANYPQGQLVQMTQYGYDEVGNLTSVTDAMGRKTQYVYDSLGRRTSTILPDATSSESTLYQTIGLAGTSCLIQSNTITGLNGKSTTNVYDIMDRVIARRPDSTLSGEVPVTFGYDAAGRRAWMEDASGHTTYTYDGDGRLTQKTTAAGTIEYFYDNAGKVVELRSSPVHVSLLGYGYDALGRLTFVNDLSWLPATTTYGYDQVGNLTSVVYPNGISHNYTYTEQYRLLSVEHKQSTTSLAHFKYTMDQAGHRIQLAELLPNSTAGGTQTESLKSYSYDSDSFQLQKTFPRLYRLTQEDWSSGRHWKYQYDQAGNRLQRSAPAANQNSYTATYDVLDRQLTDTRAAGQQPAFDGNGNQVRYPNNDADGDADPVDQVDRKLNTDDVYNFENQLKRITKLDNSTVGLVYDGDGNRVIKTTSTSSQTTLYLVDDRNPTGYAQVLEEFTLPAAPLNGMVGRWPFNEGAGTNVSDISGNGHHGVNLNGPAWLTAKSDTGLQFGSSSAQVLIPDKSDLRITGALSIAFWMRMDAVPSTAVRLIGKGAADATQNYGVWVAPDGYLYFKFDNGSSLQSAQSSSTVAVGTWYHVAVTLSPTSGTGSAQFFINGAANAPRQVTGLQVANTDPLTIGYVSGNYSQTFSGVIDEVSLYSRVLTGAEITGLTDLSKSGTLCRYALGTQIISQSRRTSGTSSWASTSTYYGYDGLGSVRALYNPSGTATDIYSYDAFGTLQPAVSAGTTVNNIRFAGQQWDPDLNLYYNRARYLNPDSGRFTSRDTFDGGAGDTANLHRYLYVGGDPVNGVDPSGRLKLTPGISRWIAKNIKRLGPALAFELAAKIFIGMVVDDRLAVEYQRETGSTKVNSDKWIGRTVDLDLPDAGWISEFALRPDIVDFDQNWVQEIKPDNDFAIALGAGQVSKYISTLKKRYPDRTFIPGLWQPKYSPYRIDHLKWLPGLEIDVDAKAVGGGVIAYTTNPSAEQIAVDIAVAYELASIAGAKAADNSRGMVQLAEVFLVSFSFGY